MAQPPIRRVSFVVPVKNDAGRLKRCLESIRGNPHGAVAVEILVADNGSTDASSEVAQSAGARVLRLPDIGVSELRNRAAAAASGELLAFVDADHVITSSWIASAVDAVSEERVGATGAIYSAPPDGTWVQRLYGALRGRTTRRADAVWLGSGNLVVRRTAFEAVHGFDSSLEACEDVDFCQRLRAAGWRIVADPRLESLHLGDPPTVGALFRAERWRGRDNLRVSFRGPMTWRDLPSVVIPVIDLACLGLLLWGLLTLPVVGWTALGAVLAAVAVILVLAATRVARALLAGRVGLSTVVQASVVALTWDIARALALVWPATHHRRTNDRNARSGTARV
jgi:hypothetical protein